MENSIQHEGKSHRMAVTTGSIASVFELEAFHDNFHYVVTVKKAYLLTLHLCGPTPQRAALVQHACTLTVNSGSSTPVTTYAWPVTTSTGPGPVFANGLHRMSIVLSPNSFCLQHEASRQWQRGSKGSDKPSEPLCQASACSMSPPSG